MVPISLKKKNMSTTKQNKTRYLADSQLSNVRKILVIQLGPFGDSLLSTSCLKSIKNKFPHARLFYIVKEPFHKVILNHPFIDEIIKIKKKSGFQYCIERVKTYFKIWKLHFDLVIDFQNKPSSQQLTLFSGANYRIGYRHGRFHQVYNFKATEKEGRYSASMKFDILEPLNIKEEPYKLFFHIGEKARNYIANWLSINNYNPSKVVCISPGSPVPRKQWSLVNFARLADMIQTRTDLNVVLLWGPRELDQVNQVKKEMKTGPVLAPPTDLNQAAALLELCKLLVCNDCGLNHLSVTTMTPTLAIFGTTSPTAWSPGPEFNHFHLYRPDFDSKKDNSFGISPEDAFNEIKKILDLNLR
ncbi:MAG: glycosyltransferase family 9 protein [Fibrobacter sp.]|nr:glycosyltransferase family 9 protein [Fibrobacter sp.]